LQKRKKLPIQSAVWLGHDVIRVDVETHQAALFKNCVDLLSPKVDRSLSKNIEQGVVLTGCEGQLHGVADKIRQHRTATAALRVEMSDIRHRHVIGKTQVRIPVQVPIQDRRSEACGAIFLRKSFDMLHVFEELRSVPEELPIMSQAVEVDFAASIAERLQKRQRRL